MVKGKRRTSNKGIGSPETLIGIVASILASIVGVKLTLQYVVKVEDMGYIDSAQVVIIGMLLVGGVVFYISDYVSTKYLNIRL